MFIQKLWSRLVGVTLVAALAAAVAAQPVAMGAGRSPALTDNNNDRVVLGFLEQSGGDWRAVRRTSNNAGTDWHPILSNAPEVLPGTQVPHTHISLASPAMTGNRGFLYAWVRTNSGATINAFVTSPESHVLNGVYGATSPTNVGRVAVGQGYDYGYAAFIQDGKLRSFRGQVNNYFTNAMDWGSSPVDVHTPASGRQIVNHPVLAVGALTGTSEPEPNYIYAAVADRLTTATDGQHEGKLHVYRSANGGLTWSLSTTINLWQSDTFWFAPVEEPLRNYAIVADPNGSEVWVIYTVKRGLEHRVEFQRSNDHGVTWTAKTVTGNRAGSINDGFGKIPTPGGGTTEGSYRIGHLAATLDDAGEVHVVYMENEPGDKQFGVVGDHDWWRVMRQRSFASGTTFGGNPGEAPPGRERVNVDDTLGGRYLSPMDAFSPDYHLPPGGSVAVAATQDHAHFAWVGTASSANQVYYRRMGLAIP